MSNSCEKFGKYFLVQSEIVLLLYDVIRVASRRIKSAWIGLECDCTDERRNLTD